MFTAIFFYIKARGALHIMIKDLSDQKVISVNSCIFRWPSNLHGSKLMYVALWESSSEFVSYMAFLAYSAVALYMIVG